MHHILCSGLLLGAGFLLSACGDTMKSSAQHSARPVLVVPVAERQMVSERRFPGRISAVGELHLGFEVPGQISALLVKPGDRVAAGQPLAQLQVERFAIAISQEESGVAVAAAAAAEAEAAFARAEGLRAREAIAQAEFDRAQATVDAARAQVRGAEAGLEQARKNLSDATLISPYDGLVAERLIEDFSQVQAKQAVFILQAYDRLRVSIQVPESYVLSLRGDREERRRQLPLAMVQFLGHEDDEYAATFDEVITTPNLQTLTWSIHFLLPVPDDLTVLPGMSCMVRLQGVGEALAPSGTWVPLTALVENAAGETALWVVGSDKRVQRRSVSLGPIHHGEVAIVDGVSVGELVVRAGQSFLREGMLVNAQQANAQQANAQQVESQRP